MREKVLIINATALRKKEILPYTATWVNLEDLMLSDISEKEKKDKYCMISLICGF